MSEQIESLDPDEVTQNANWPIIPQEYREVLSTLDFKEETIKNIPSFTLEIQKEIQEFVVNDKSYKKNISIKLRIVYMGEVDVDGAKSQEFHSSFNINNTLDLFGEPYYEDIHCDCLNSETEFKQYINFLMKNF